MNVFSANQGIPTTLHFCLREAGLGTSTIQNSAYHQQNRSRSTTSSFSARDSEPMHVNTWPAWDSLPADIVWRGTGLGHGALITQTLDLRHQKLGRVAARSMGQHTLRNKECRCREKGCENEAKISVGVWLREGSKVCQQL